MENILFIRLRLLGDIIFTIPAIKLLKKHHPNTNIYYVVEQKFKEIGELLPDVHELIVLPRKTSMKQHFQFRKQIKSLGIDTVVDFHSGPKSALLTRFTGAAKRIGYKTPNRNYAYTHKTPRKFGDTYTHSVYNQCKLLEHLDIPVENETLPPYPAVPIDETKINDTLKQFIKQSSKQLNSTKKIVLHVGAGNRFRDWGIENFSALIQRLTDDNIAIFLVGHSQEEQEKGSFLENKHPLHNLTGQLSLRETLYLVSQSDVYFGVDSGPLHLASLTQTPIVTMYGPNIPEVSGPWRQDNVTILQLPLACRPCSQRKCQYNYIKCMKDIKTDDAYQAILRYLQ